MAYQTGTATNVTDLLSKLAEFAVNLNWTIQKNSTNVLYLSNADGYWALEFKDDMLFVIASTGLAYRSVKRTGQIKAWRSKRKDKIKL